MLAHVEREKVPRPSASSPSSETKSTPFDQRIPAAHGSTLRGTHSPAVKSRRYQVKALGAILSAPGSLWRPVGAPTSTEADARPCHPMGGTFVSGYGDSTADGSNRCE